MALEESRCSTSFIQFNGCGGHPSLHTLQPLLDRLCVGRLAKLRQISHGEHLHPDVPASLGICHRTFDRLASLCFVAESCTSTPKQTRCLSAQQRVELLDLEHTLRHLCLIDNYTQATLQHG
jgi:hypothetical protein